MSGDAIDSNLLTKNVGRRAELALPHAMADNDTFVERQAEDSGEVRRHGGYWHECRLAGHRDGTRRYARGTNPLEYIVSTSGVKILLFGEGACFALRVLPKYRDESVERSQRKRSLCQAATESTNGNNARDAQRDRQ